LYSLCCSYCKFKVSETERKNTILFEKGIYGIGKHTQDIHIHKQVYRHSQNTKTNTHTQHL
jgi:hypothetical protein